MQEKETIRYCLEAFRKAGVQKAQGFLQKTERHELNVAAGKISLLRTTYDTNLQLAAIINEKKGSLSVNTIEADCLDHTVRDVVAMAKSSQADPAFDIAEPQAPQEFSSGPEKPDLDLMYDRLCGFLEYCRQMYPKTILSEIGFQFVRKHRYFQNTHDVDFGAYQGIYDFIAVFTSKDGVQTSSMNFSGFSTQKIDNELQTFGSLETLLRQSSEQVCTSSLMQKGEIDVIFTPDCVGLFVGYIVKLIGDYALISGKSIFRDKLCELIASPMLTLRSCPLSEEIADGYFFTNDGYVAQNSVIIEKGKLKTFLLSLYGARKTNYTRAVNDGGSYVIDAGPNSLNEMIASTRKGILLGRFSGGAPSFSGDFTGVAKNSFYIENGEIQYPLSETMISGNLAEMLKNIRFISQERIFFGNEILPWIQVRGITASGK